MSFQKGDLLLCVANDVLNPGWKGKKPTIGNYYTYRADYSHEPEYFGYVEEIVNEINPKSGDEYTMAKRWFIKVNVDINIEQLLQECIN